MEKMKQKVHFISCGTSKNISIGITREREGKIVN
jgi:hypothetical protein